jgi:hypothetical protein
METVKFGHGLGRLPYQVATTSAGPAGGRRLDCPSRQSHGWVAMEVETKFLRLFKPVAIGDRIDGCACAGLAVGTNTGCFSW